MAASSTKQLHAGTRSARGNDFFYLLHKHACADAKACQRPLTSCFVILWLGYSARNFWALRAVILRVVV
jgi:hypothetical protein